MIDNQTNNNSLWPKIEAKLLEWYNLRESILMRILLNTLFFGGYLGFLTLFVNQNAVTIETIVIFTASIFAGYAGLVKIFFNGEEKKIIKESLYIIIAFSLVTFYFTFFTNSLDSSNPYYQAFVLFVTLLTEIVAIVIVFMIVIVIIKGIIALIKYLINYLVNKNILKK